MDTVLTLAASFPLLDDDFVDGAVDYKGQPAHRSRSGGWRSAFFIISVEMVERFAYYGVSCNLISYLTGPLRQSTAVAAENVNIWSGVASIVPLFGAFLADSYIGRFRMIVMASILYILGLGLLTFSALLPGSGSDDCTKAESCPSLSVFQILFFASLYMVALAQGGYKPCVQAFGADQFDSQHLKESKARNSFFNWWYFGICGGTLVSLWIVIYIQDDISWALGFGVPCISMIFGLFMFLLGTKTYRHMITHTASLLNKHGRPIRPQKQKGDPLFTETESNASSVQAKFRFHHEVAKISLKDNWNTCIVTQAEEVHSALQLIPIWLSCLVYAVVFAQSTTFFTKQGSTMDKKITPHVEVPAATLQSFISLSIVLFMPIYDRIFVPVVRSFTNVASGITMLQRIGTGIFISAASMVVAAVVERRRLLVAKQSVTADDASTVVPMSILWLVPQYVLFGIADVFTMVGLQEFFYDQVPNGLRSFGLALYLSIFGIGNFLSGFLVWVIDKVTKAMGRVSWFTSSLNDAHLDYFYWLLAGLSLVELALFVTSARSYVYTLNNTRSVR